ncbi:apicoplast pyruvate carrier 1-like isoform X2 [Tachypleus tridentatus]|uniref:apicoplast pyruvate carrier 1-like isoform X2 n=2 Tax=Tachypleus tridentatus TaxID=6853 RepID=UPI003FD03F51
MAGEVDVNVARRTCVVDQKKSMMFKSYGYLAVCGSFLIHLTLGTFYTFGNMNTYMMSYIKSKVDESVSYSQSVWINSVMIFGQGLMMPFGGVLEHRYGARVTCFIGCLIFSSCIALSTFAIKSGFVATAAVYGFLSSCGLGFAYVAPLANGMKWFPHRKGLVNGIVVGGFGLGALIFNQIQTGFLNPENKSPENDGYFEDAEILDRVPKMFLLLGGVYAAIELIGCIILFSPPTEILSDETALLESSNNSDSDAQDTTVYEEKNIMDYKTKKAISDLPPSEAVKTKEFYMLWFTFALNIQCVQFTNTMYKAFGQTFIFDDHFLAIVGSIASVFNSVGRIFWGSLQDKTSYKTCMVCLCGILCALMMSFIATPQGEKVMFSVWVLLIFFTFSGLFVLFPTTTAQTFGPTYSGTNYGLIFTAPALSSLVGAFIIEKVQNSFGWFGTFSFIGGMSLTALFITLFYPHNPEIVRRRHQ